MRGGDLSEDESDLDADEAEDVGELSEVESRGSEDESDDEDVVESQQEEEGEDSDGEDAAESEQEEEEKAELIGPVKLSIRTNLNCPITDQSLEFTASGKRSVESLKQGMLYARFFCLNRSMEYCLIALVLCVYV
jgi:hypothetical protein